MKGKLNYKILIKAIIIVCIAIVLDVMGFAFLALKLVSIPFVPNRNIDDISDFYTAVWESVKGNSVDNGRLFVIDVTDNTRKEIADILSAVSGMNPKVIGLDVTNYFEEDESVDSCFVNTIQSIPNIILPVECQDVESDSPRFLYSIFADKLHDKEYGVVSFPENRDVLRTYRPSFRNGENTIDAFSCAIARAYGADISPVINKNKTLINYTTLCLTDDDANEGGEFLNLNEQDSVYLASEISNRIVLLGSTHFTGDQHLTPLGYSLSGVMIHAHIINSLIDHKNIASIPLVFRYLICFILAIGLIVLLEKHTPAKRDSKLWEAILKYVMLFIVSVVLFAVVGTVLFCKYSYYIDFAPFIVTSILVYILKNKQFDFRK